MKLKKFVFTAALLAAGSPVMAASCTSLGTMGPAYVASFGNSFTSATLIDDCYTFALSSAADAVGVTVAWDWSNSLNIGLNSISLSGGGNTTTFANPIPQVFSFSNLQSGTFYTLSVGGQVTNTGNSGVGWGVGYQGLLATSAPSIASPVPEPATLAMLACGFAVVSWGSRRKA